MLHIIAITMQHGMCGHGTVKSHLVFKMCVFWMRNVGEGGVHTPGCDPSFSIRLYVLGQHNSEYSLPTPPTMDHFHHIAQFVWSNT
jgi:hypothetical protein